MIPKSMHSAYNLTTSRCGVLCNVGPAPAAVRLLPARRTSQQSAANTQYQQLADDLDIIDSLFEAATAKQDDINQPPSPTSGTKQQALANTANTRGKKAPNLPQRTTQLPWNSSNSKPSSAPQTAAKVLQQLTLKKQLAAQPSSSSWPGIGNSTSRSPSSKRKSSRGMSSNQLHSADHDFGLDSIDEWTAVKNSADEASKSVPINPWLRRQQQQRQQRRKLAKQRAGAAAVAAAAREQWEQAQGLAAKQAQRQQQQGQAILQQQQQQRPHMEIAPSSEANTTDLATQNTQQQLQRQRQRQQEQQQLSQQIPQGQLALQMDQLHMQAGQPAARQTARQAISDSTSSNSISSSTCCSAPDVSSAVVHPSRSPSLQQPHIMPEQQDISTTQQQQLHLWPLAAANDDGIVRSARRLRMQPRKQPEMDITPQLQQQQQQEQQSDGSSRLPAAESLTIAIGSNVSDSAAAITPNLGQSPLIVLGGQAAGSTVVWTQQASIAAADSLQDAAATAAAPQQQVQQQVQRHRQQEQHGHHQQQQPVAHAATHQQLQPSIPHSSKEHSDSPPLQSQGLKQTPAGGPTAAVAAAGTRRFRRGRSVQGMASSPPPGPDDPLSAAEVWAAVDGTTVPAAEQLPTKPDTAGNAERWGSSSSSGMGEQQLQQQLSKLDSSNWQRLAEQLLPDLYEPSWHSSLYTLMQDVWPVVLKAGTAPTVFTRTSGVAVVADYGDSSSSSQSTSVAWAVACLYHGQQYVWASALLALVNCLEGDDSANLQLSVQAVQSLPLELLEQLVLPAAEIMDDEVHGALQQQLRRQQAAMSNSTPTAAAAAAQSLFGPAPWAINQQQQQPQQSSSKHVGQTDTALLTGGEIASAAGSSRGAEDAVGQKAVPGAGQVVGMIYEVHQLQRLYPGVNMAALAHIVQQHGLWQS